MSTRPIGIFDSGVGGLTVWKTLLDAFPNESFVYFADTKNCPYGIKTDEEIIRLSDRITRFLIVKGCKIIVIACNTATSASVRFLRNKYEVPIIGIEPAIKPASLLSKTGNIGVLATQSTINGNHFKQTSGKYAKDKNVIIQVGYGLVEQVENNQINTSKTIQLIQGYIQPMLKADVDYIVLGCTHYPLLSSVIKKEIGDKQIILLEPSEAIAKQVEVILQRHQLKNKSKINRNTVVYTSSFSLNSVKNVLKLLEVPSNESVNIGETKV